MGSTTAPSARDVTSQLFERDRRSGGEQVDFAGSPPLCRQKRPFDYIAHMHQWSEVTPQSHSWKEPSAHELGKFVEFSFAANPVDHAGSEYYRRDLQLMAELEGHLFAGEFALLVGRH